MKVNNRVALDLYGEAPWPVFEGRRYRIGALSRHRELRLCDRCMHHRCWDTVSERHARTTPRSWKHQRRARRQWMRDQ